MATILHMMDLNPLYFEASLILCLAGPKYTLSLNPAYGEKFTDQLDALFQKSRDGKRQSLVKYSPYCHEVR